MTARRGMAAVAVVLVAGAVLAAGGVIPNPFDPPDLEIVDSGTEEARERAGEIRPREPASDNPFDIPIPIVESGTQEARDLVGEWFEEMHDPFQLPPIPVVESGTEEAWIAHGEFFPPDPEIRRRHEAAFTADSQFPPNPESPLGLYRFDLIIHQVVDSASGVDSLTYFANTADGSLLFPSWSLEGGLPPGLSDHGELHFVIRQADGDLMACGKHREFGNACLLMGDDLGRGFAWLRDMSLHRRFLESIPRTPQALGEGPGGPFQGVRGRSEGTHIQMWLSRSASRVSTQVPFIGAGVGVMKDFRTRANRTVKRTRWEGVDHDGGDLVIDLVAMAPSRSERDTSLYRFITAFTTEGLEEANRIGMGLQQMQAQAMEIEQAIAACPGGSAGRECRRVNRERMKALNESARDQALDFGRRHGLPVGDD